jgi:hypothetical protein
LCYLPSSTYFILNVSSVREAAVQNLQSELHELAILNRSRFGLRTTTVAKSGILIN